MKRQPKMRLNGFTTLFYVGMGLMMNALTPSHAIAGDHIQLVREAFIENGPVGGVNPRVLVQTHEGGYVIAGRSSTPWAVQVDASGKTQWQYSATSDLTGSEYSSAAVLPNDSVILCGSAQIKEKNWIKSFGLLTEIDKGGRVVQQKLILPQNNSKYQPIGIGASVSVGDGIVLLGRATLSREERPYGWFIKLDNMGTMKWEKLFPKAGGELQSLQVLPSQAIVFSTFAPSKENALLAGSLIARLNHDGEIDADYSISDGAKQAIPLLPDSIIHLIFPNHKKASLFTFDEHLREIGKASGDHALIYTNRAYLLPDQSMVLFGRQGKADGSYTAALQWISADLSQTQTMVLSPEYASFEIADAVPTGVPGVFAFVRQVSPKKAFFGHDETRHGVVLGFVQIKS